MRFDPVVEAVGDDADGAVAVCPVDLGADAFVAFQHFRVGMVEGVQVTAGKNHIPVCVVGGGTAGMAFVALFLR